MKPLFHRLRNVITIIWLFALLLTPATLFIRPALAATTVTTELESIADARVQGGSPDVGFGNGFIWVGTPEGHRAYVQFDLLSLPANATIDSAELRLNFTGTYTPTANVEVGRNDSAWDEATITWNTRPDSTFNGNSQTIGDTAGDITWNVTPLVQQWVDGTVSNYGFALRGDGPLKSFHSHETSSTSPPKLIITYTIPDDTEPRPDLGDAPDSSNNLGVNPNTAYPGVPGNFPTVWNGTPVGQAAGPRHANQTGEGILGQYLSREVEADSGADQDGVNNILNGGANNADNDRGDDGWRNRQASFDHCAPTTLTVRVSKAQNATLNRMYLNVWFDGNHDGDWDDRDLCTPENEALAVPATEWIVQDYYVDMTGIPAGGYVDINVNTETVLNTTPDRRHWMRFTLSEERAVQTTNGRADGRGPHPNNTPGSYQFGETEDILQRPQLPGEDGELIIEKRVLNAEPSVSYAGTVTYEIRLRHAGGTQPVQAQIRDELPYPLHLLPRIENGQVEYITVASSTGGATPLQASLDYTSDVPLNQVVTWQGTLAPDAEVRLSFDVHVHPICSPNQQTETITNVAQARLRDGNPITAEVDFIAQCPGYNPTSIDIDLEPIENQPIDLNDLNQLPWQGFVRNNHAIPVTLRVTPHLTGTLPTNGAIALPSFEKITLEPGASQPVEFKFRLRDRVDNELNLPADMTFNATLDYCILPGENATECLDATQYPHLHGQSDPVTINVRPRDLGDAPDSTNHPATAMTAYPGVQANFPTVFDPATGLPEGPMHAHPQPFHLGQQVSREAEADVGPDQDPTNNILPAANTPDQDRFDDGINPQQWSLNHCQATTLPVRVFISPQAVNWFQQQEKPGYLNIWLDGNRDGDWEDSGTCPNNQEVVEHIVIDQPVDVVSLGAGLHTISVPTGLVPWPAQQAENPAWVRVTLSERESNKTLQPGTIKYGDGRGYDKPFQTGETEDYLAYPEGTVGGGPDMDVQIDGRFAQTNRVAFKITYTNLGTRTASDAILTFQKPEQLRDMEIILLRTPGIPQTNITQSSDEVQVALPGIQPGASGTVVLGWDLTPPRAAALAAEGENYTARARIVQNGDTNPDNNQAEVTVQSPTTVPIIAAVVADNLAWGLRETTCRSDVNLAGRAAPGVAYDLMLDGNISASVSADANGTFTYLLQNLSDGRHSVRLEAAQSSRTLLLDVDTSLAIDPLSLVFTDSQGRNVHPPTLGWPLSPNDIGVSLRSGETYEVGIDSCGNDPNVRIVVTVSATQSVTLRDDDGDGRYTGSFTFTTTPIQRSALAASTELRFDVTTSSTSQSFVAPLHTLTPGVVRDARTSQPIANASVTALAAQETDNGTTFTAWPEAALGQPNPQLTAADGSYSFSTPGDSSRLDVTHTGYQPYQSGDIQTPDGILNQDIALMPEIAAAPDYTIYISANSFEPASITVAPGSVIEWVNLDLAQHTTTSNTWNSGTLNAGQSYRLQLDNPGTYTYQDSANPLTRATIIVDDNQASGDTTVFLPLVAR